MPRENILDTDIKFIKGIGEKKAALFASLGVRTVGELLFYFPRAYENWQKICPLAEAPLHENVCVKATVLSSFSVRGTRSGKTVYSTVARDESGYVGLVFFNNKYVRNMISDGDTLYLYGKIGRAENGASEMINPAFVNALRESPCLHAVYPQTAGLNSRAISSAVKNALDAYGSFIAETLPAEQTEKYRLKALRDAVRLIHFPSSEEDITAARRRLIYEELLTLQLGLLLRGKGDKGTTGCVISSDKTDEFESFLPYKLTFAQKRAAAECLADMKKNVPMRRLLQGDVGSGKTAVAACLMYSAAADGYQSVIMAPTEVLAKQHYETLVRLFTPRGLKVGLLTGSMTAKEKREVRQELKNGGINILAGTHAVISAGTEFARLGLAVTDEQHRFGVMQRAALREKGEDPHILVMSATPIPRTLSLIIYGDLDISVLDEKPSGRREIKTYSVDSSYHKRLYRFISERAAKGEKSFIVCPRIEADAEENGTAVKVAAGEYVKTLSCEMPGVRIGLLHGKMKQKEKDAAMEAFASGDTDVLVCTVVIEVGIDVPAATVMVIENAECFGLSQLHQLRGRVGRGEKQSFCILVSDAAGDAAERLGVMCRTTDGFEVARQDLERRGPGDFFGSRQSGLPVLGLADLMTDSKILFAARAEAEKILADDPGLKNPAYRAIREKTEKMFTDIS